jgi:hypothetical protein
MNTSIPISINLTFQQLAEAVKKLPPSEKSLLNDMLWDETMPVPPEHQSLVLSRIEKSKESTEILPDWESASQTLLL